MGQVGSLSSGRTAASLFLLACLAGCDARHTNFATYRPSAASGVQSTGAAQPRQSSETLLYITDRAPARASDGTLSYGAERATFVSFGTVALTPTGDPPAGKAGMLPGTVSEIGRFPPTPYGVVATADGLRRTPTVVASHEQATASLQDEMARRLATAPRKEVLVFIHGYRNTFADAARATGEICRSLKNEFVCVVLTWPAGGSGGLFFGYNIDRESSEFAVADLKKAIRIIAESQGIERLHLLAHSRGTDVLASAIQQLTIEAYVSRSSLWRRYKIANVVFFAPDIDLDVASSKMFAWVSDPDLAFGSGSSPGAFPPQGEMHLTIYSSPRDNALRASTLLSGSALRLGQLAVDKSRKHRIQASKWEGFQMGRLVDFIEFSGGRSLIGHSYFSDPAIKTDLAALIRDRVEAGDPRRPLIEVNRPFWRISNVRQSSQRSPGSACRVAGCRTGSH